MKQYLFFILLAGNFFIAPAQSSTDTLPPVFKMQKQAKVTPVKDQSHSGTCWCFSTISLVESQCIKNKLGEFDLSEMFTVRNIYTEKAKNYVLRQGHAQFGEGGLGHDLIRSIATYGAMPETVYSGILPGQDHHDHEKLAKDLKNYLDSILQLKPIAINWLDGFEKILDDAMGKAPSSFEYKGKNYTPKTFAQTVLKFNANDYVNITSFTHQPYYKSFILQVPDNFSNGFYYNIPLKEMIQLTKDVVSKGYSVMWDADVSNSGFRQNTGLALLLNPRIKYYPELIKADMAEDNWDAEKRQQLYENLTTQDDHLMHLYGVEKTPGGKDFFLVKNSWGYVGPYKGSINVSEAYFAINTISLVVPKVALNKVLLAKLGVK